MRLWVLNALPLLKYSGPKGETSLVKWEAKHANGHRVEGGYLMSTRASFFTYLVLRYRGLAPSAGNSLARRRQKSEIGVASATAPRRHEFPRRKRIGARSMMFSRRPGPSRPRFSGFVKVAARSKSTTSGTCRSLPATYNLAIAQPQPAQIPAQ